MHRSPRQSAFALVTTMLLLALLIAITMQLATVTATEAVCGTRRHRTLAHELALDSALLVVADRLQSDGRVGAQLIEELDRQGSAQLSFDIATVTVSCTIGDDAAKFNPNLFPRSDQHVMLSPKLSQLAARQRMPTAKVILRPRNLPSGNTVPPYCWFDQLLHDLEPGILFGLTDGSELHATRAWSELVTFWGDGRIDLRRANVDVLEVALEDLQPGLAAKMLALRPTDRALDFRATALIAVPAEIREQVAGRIAFNARRYALDLETKVEADRRRWCVVAEINDEKLSVLHRGQVTW